MSGSCCLKSGRDADAGGRRGLPVRVGAFEISEVRYLPGQRLARHSHDRASVVIVLDGAYEESVGGRRTDLTAGRCLLRAPAQTHANAFALGCRVILAMLDTEASTALLRGGTRFDRSGCRTLPVAQPGLAAPGPWAGADLLDLEEHLLAILRASGSGGPRRDDQTPPRWLGAVVDDLHGGGASDSVASVAARHQIDPGHLARTFRRFRGCTLSAYARRLRAQRAATALRRSEAPIARIAARHGFSDQSHLGRAFREAFGVTPGAYRTAADPFVTPDAPRKIRSM